MSSVGAPPTELIAQDPHEGAPSTDLPVRQIGQWALIWRRFKRHRLALAGALVALVVIALAVVGPYLSPGFIKPDQFGQLPLWATRQANEAPQLRWPYLMGTDPSGNPILSYVLTGGRAILIIGVLGSLLASLLGMLIGGIAGYLGGLVDALLMRVVDAFLAIPFLLLLILFSQQLPFDRRGALMFAALFGIAGWPGIARLVRGYVLSLREREFTEAARALGVSSWGIILRHVLPNALDVLVVSFTLNVGVFMVTEATLDFLGAGTSDVTWASELAGTYTSILGGYWWQYVFPGFCLLSAVLAVNFLGDGLRDAFDATSATALATATLEEQRVREPGPMRRRLSAVGAGIVRARRVMGAAFAPFHPARLWSRAPAQRPMPAWTTRRQVREYREAPLPLRLGPIALAFAACGVAFLDGHSPLMYAPNYAPPAVVASTDAQQDYAAWPRRRGGWDLFSVDSAGRLTYRRLDAAGSVTLTQAIASGGTGSQPSMAKNGGQTLGAWLAGNGQVVLAAYLGKHRSPAIALNPAGAAEHPDAIALPGGFGVLFDWQPAGRAAYDLYLAVLHRGTKPRLVRLVRSGDYAMIPRGMVDGSGNIDLIWLQRFSPGLWHVLFQRFTPGGTSLGHSVRLGLISYLEPGSNGCNIPNVAPGAWAIDLKQAADGSVWAAWEDGNDCDARGGISGTNVLYVGRWDRNGKAILPRSTVSPFVDPNGQAVALALHGKGGILYYPVPGRFEPYLAGQPFSADGTPGTLERVNYEGGGAAANPQARTIRRRPTVIWEKVRTDGIRLQTTAYRPAQQPDLLTRLGLNIGNLGGNVALVLFGSLAGGLLLTLINAYLLVPLVLVWFVVRRLPPLVRWPLYLAAIGLLLAWLFALHPTPPGYVLVISALGLPDAWFAVAGGVFVSGWAGRYLFGRRESTLRATAMALLALYVVAAMYAVMFIEGQIGQI